MCNVRIKQGIEQAPGGLQKKNPKTGMVHVIKSAEDIIEFNDASMTTLTETKKNNPEDPKVKAKRDK